MEPRVNRGSVQSLAMLIGVAVWLATMLVMPVVAQEDGEPAEEATPAPTTTPAASPPEPLPSRAPAAPVTTDEPDVPMPPSVAVAVFSDPLTGDAVFPTGSCPSDAASGQNVGEGFRLLVRGPCVDGRGVADLAVPARGIMVWDGEIALDFKVVVGPERTQVALYARSKDRKLVVARLESGLRKLSLYRFEEGTETVLASRDDLAGRLTPTDWSRLALRFRGGEVWVLLDGRALLHATSVPDQAGAAGLQVLREGSPDDGAEVAVVFRDLALSPLADADPSRAPTRSTP